jgi:hypothetical protein
MVMTTVTRDWDSESVLCDSPLELLVKRDVANEIW